MSAVSAPIGFIGLGAMGAPMAGHLLDAGHTLVVHTRSPGSASALTARGARWVASPRAVAQAARTVFTVLPGPKEVEAVVLGEAGLLAGFTAPATLVDMSTNAPALVRALGARLAEAGHAMLDAPVSGGPKGARSGRLAIWASGDEAAFETTLPLLRAMGDQVQFLGALGSASIAKLVHNCANYGIQMVLAEAFSLGVKAGLDPTTLFRAVRQGSLGRQNIVDRLADQFLPGDFDTVAFALDLAFKDVSLAAQLGREASVPMRFAEMTLAEMTEARNRGWGQRDSRVAMLVQEQRAGVHIEVDRDALRAILSN